MAKPPLSVHNAEITTARVEVKTLTISGKQVTLAVFRQLREESLIEDDGVLAGQPWGVVNYHPDKCGDRPAHWHVVWQRGSDLLRSAVPQTIQHGTFWPDEADRFITSCVNDLAATGVVAYFDGDLPLNDLVRPRASHHDDGVLLATEADFPVRMALSPAGREVALAILRNEHVGSEADPEDRAELRPHQRSAVEKREQQRRALAEEVESYGATTEQLHADYLAVLNAETARRARYAAALQTVAELPQLFIAV